MSNPVSQKLATRGFWRVEIRPSDFVERRIASIKTLQKVVEKSTVRFRGWDFPHLLVEWPLPEDQSLIGIDSDWSVHVETWRAYLSGQFVYRGGVWIDWLDQHHFPSNDQARLPGTGLPITSSLWSLTEFLEFAARYAQTEAGADSMVVDISLHGLKGRTLFDDNSERAWYRDYGPAKMQTFRFRRELSRADLMSHARKLAIEASAELFSAFGWDAGSELLESIQAELFSIRRGA